MASNHFSLRKVGTLSIPPIVNGLWQIGNGSLGDKCPSNGEFVKYMIQYSNAGLYCWDGADHYGPSEDIMGLHKQQTKNGVYFTKYVPEMGGKISLKITENAINKSLNRMKTSSLDLLQFHWWDYNNPDGYITVLKYLKQIQSKGKIKNIGLTNFNTFHLRNIVQKIPNIQIVSNQLPYSLIDNRIEKNMIPFCIKHNIKILTYGTLLGGFLSSKYLGMDTEPKRKSDLYTVSLKRYYKFIMSWSGNNWSLFQELLRILWQIGKQHNATISQIAVAFILDKVCVAGVIIGCRLSVSNHIVETCDILKIKLTQNDKELIQKVIRKGRQIYGEPADEHRGAKL